MKGVLELGSNWQCSADSTIICNKHISFGDNCLLSWDILIMDTDFHKIYDCDDQIVNTDRDISVGNHVWIGCRSTILKGSIIDDDIVISLGSTVSGNLSQPHAIYSVKGHEYKILKDNINWLQ